MNFKIKLTKTNTADAVVAIEFIRNDYMLHYDLINVTSEIVEREFNQELELGESYLLRISRHEHDLYTTDKTAHDSYVIVEQIQIDDFWAIDDKNHWSTTVYDDKYVQHLSDKPHTWELTKDLYNNTLFFNGSIDYTIKTPIRNMYFK